ncbi:hypothetical protein KCU91_g7677, partial [Aureobasidium melanogenum]
MPICFPRLHCRHHRRRRRRRRRHRHLHRHSYYSIIPASPVPPLQKHDAVQAARATISPPCKTQPRLDFYNTPAIRNAQPLLKTPSDHIPVDPTSLRLWPPTSADTTAACVVVSLFRHVATTIIESRLLRSLGGWVRMFVSDSAGRVFIMTTEIQIEGLTLKLRTDSALPLIVKDQSVVAIFEDPTTKKKDSLGQVSDRNGCSDILRLSIGVNQKTSRLFITLAIWIRTGRVRNKNKSKGRLMFLVVPAESLALETAFDDHDAIVKQFPGISFESPSDDKSRKHKLMRMSFVMESMRSHVIMPQYKRQANAKGQQMALLRKLRSLSESDKFQLVANYDEATSTAIQNVCKTLSQTAITPSVILEELYSSKQSGCIDEWVKQGWCARDSTNLDVVGNPKDFETVNVPQHTLDPPQYELRAPSFEELFSSRSKNCIGLQASLGLAGDHSLQTSPCLPSTAPPYSTCAELDSYPYETAYQHASAVTPDSHGTPGHAMVTHSDYAEIFSIPPSEDPLTPMPTSSDYIGTFLSGFSSCPNSAPIVPLGHGKSRSSIDQSVQEKTCSSFRRSSKDPSARVQIPATSPRLANKKTPTIAISKQRDGEARHSAVFYGWSSWFLLPQNA